MKVKILQILPVPDDLWGVFWIDNDPRKPNYVAPVALALVQEVDNPNNTFVDGISVDGRPFCCEKEHWETWQGLGWGPNPTLEKIERDSDLWRKSQMELERQQQTQRPTTWPQ